MYTSVTFRNATSLSHANMRLIRIQNAKCNEKKLTSRRSQDNVRTTNAFFVGGQRTMSLDQSGNLVSEANALDQRPTLTGSSVGSAAI